MSDANAADKLLKRIRDRQEGEEEEMREEKRWGKLEAMEVEVRVEEE